jgi:acetate---CoA ligase (ADP-forming)
MTMAPQRLDGAALAQALLHPRSVALIGISDDVSKPAARPLQFLRRAGFAGAIYPVNPRRETVQGERAYANLAALPAVPEHAFVMTATEHVLDTLVECERVGVKVATVLASGFSEAGPEGAVREQAVREFARTSAMRVVGPASLGVVHPASGLLLTANAAFAERDLPPGKVFVASHSGSMIGALLSRGKARGIGFAGLVSVGVEVDLSLGQICSATLDDPEIDSYLLFLESLRRGADLQRFAREAARRGKPVIAYKLGRSHAAAEMATTHTGALAGEDDVADAFLRGLGIARVGVLEALLEAPALARRIPLAAGGPVRPPRVGVVTTTGGGAAMVVDQLGIRGVVVEPPSPATLARLAAANLPATPGRVLDVGLAGARYETMQQVLAILLDAPEFDLVVSVVGSSARFQPELAVKPVIEAARTAARPLAAMLVPDAPQALAELTAAGVPCFHNPEACADAIAAVLQRRAPSADVPPPPPARDGASFVDEAQAYELLDRLGIAHAPVVKTPLHAEPPPLPFDFPVVAKVCSAQIPHKTEVGGVVLGIRDANALRQAFATLRRNLAQRAPGIECRDVLVQPMRGGMIEALIGYRVDAEAGPLVMLAAGGIWAEVAQDRALRLAPVSVEEAHEMISEVKAFRSLAGLRGRPRGDLDALAQALSALSQLALQPQLRVVEAEVNPLMVLPQGQGVLAVDALVLQGRP